MTDAHVGLAGQLARLPQRQVLSDDVYETVKGLIMDSVVEPGTRLNIDALTRELGISQTPIRESLARLESDGLVIKEPLRGYRVSSRLTREEFEAREEELVARFGGREPAGHEHDAAGEEERAIVEFVGADALLQGVEAHADIQITTALSAEVGLDYVRGSLRASGDPLPRMPPLRGRAGLRYQISAFQIGGDVLAIPRVKQYVTVIGEVQNPTAHVYKSGLDRTDYIRLSGGTTQRADGKRIYVVRADGSVAPQDGASWFGGGGLQLEPGDTVVVPLDAERMRPLPLWTAVTTIIYNLAVAVAAIGSL